MNAAQSEKSKEKDPATGRLREVLALVWELVKPRRGLLAVGFVLMGINRVAGLVLPASTKYLVDDVLGRRHVELLVPLVLAVFAAASKLTWGGCRSHSSTRTKRAHSSPAS